MTTAYEKAMTEIRACEKWLAELRAFVRMHDLLQPCDEGLVARGYELTDRDEPNVPSSVESKPEDETGDPPDEPDLGPTQTERLASQVLAEHGSLRARPLFELMAERGYAPAGRNPLEVLRNRLYRSPFFQNDRGVFSLKHEVPANERTA